MRVAKVVSLRTDTSYLVAIYTKYIWSVHYFRVGLSLLLPYIGLPNYKTADCRIIVLLITTNGKRLSSSDIVTLVW